MSTTRSTRQASWLTVAKREIVARLSDPAFWVGTLTTIALIIVGFALSSFFFSSNETKVAVSSDEAQAIVQLAAQEGESITPLRLSEDEVSKAVAAGDAQASLTKKDNDWVVTIKDFRDRPSLDEAVLQHQVDLNAKAHGVQGSQILAHSQIQTVVTGSDNGLGIMIASMAFSFLFMFSVVNYGMQIAQSVTTEKESRIVEILAAAVPTRQLLIGKVVGNTILALAQVMVLASAALIGLSMTDFASMIGMIAPVTGWFVLFFLVGFAALACLWAAAGAMATRIQDLTQTTTPLLMVVMLVYFLGMSATGTLAKVLSYVPIASTVLMPGQLLRGEATWVDACLALLAMVAFMVVAIWFGSGVYRRGLLQTNTVMSFKQALTGR